jgi:hypothetical protein
VHFSPITKLASKIIYNHSAEIFSAFGISVLSFLVTWETLGKKLQRTIAPKAPKDSPDKEVSKARKALGWTARFTLSVGAGCLSLLLYSQIISIVKDFIPPLGE